MIDLSNYYLGLIQLNPFEYDRTKARRMIGDINYDPFSDIDILTGFIQGLVILLKKENDKYIDEYSSRYKNEIKYELNKTNNYGVKLTYVKPFTEVYTTPTKLFIKEDLEDNPELFEEMLDYEYVIQYSKIEKEAVPVIINDSLMHTVREEYYEKNFQTDSVKEKKF